MDAAKIQQLLAPFVGLEDQRSSANDVAGISIYVDLLFRWNTRINLTAIRDPEEIVTRHFGESFFAARHLFPIGDHNAPDVTSKRIPDDRHNPPQTRMADLGSGAGFPGIPIKLWHPQIQLTLIESNHKKAAFLREVIRALNLKDATVQSGRAETLSPGSFDLVTLRAVERFAGTLPIAARLVVPSGKLALLISSSQIEVTKSVLPNIVWGSPIPIPLSQSRVFLVGQLR